MRRLLVATLALLVLGAGCAVEPLAVRRREILHIERTEQSGYVIEQGHRCQVWSTVREKP